MLLKIKKKSNFSNYIKFYLLKAKSLEKSLDLNKNPAYLKQNEKYFNKCIKSIDIMYNIFLKSLFQTK